MRLTSIFLAAAALGLAGCTTAVQYVVLTDVPSEPSVTVLPASSSGQDLLAADALAEDLVSCGVRVLERPPLIRERSDYEGKASGTGVGLTSSGKLAVLGGGGKQEGQLTISVDPVALIEETKADYVIFARPGPWLKVVKRADGQVLHVGTLSDVDGNSGCCLFPSFWANITGSKTSPRDRLRTLMQRLGII